MPNNRTYDYICPKDTEKLLGWRSKKIHDRDCIACNKNKPTYPCCSCAKKDICNNHQDGGCEDYVKSYG